MRDKVLPYSRTPQILTLLKDYGPMSLRGIQFLLRPEMSTRALQICLKRLHERGLLLRRYEKLWENKAVFHQLGQKDSQLKQVSEIIGCSLESLRQPEYRYRELLHTQACGVWAHQLKSLLPDCILYRDFQIGLDADAKHALLSIQNEVEVKPDLLLKIPSLHGTGFAYAGIEIEKTQKSDSRLIMKLEKYARGTKLDGVLYVCDFGGLSDTLRCIYSDKVLPDSTRIKHYSDNYFVFTEGLPKVIGYDTIVRNTSTDELSLRKWIHFLRSTSNTTRKAASQNLFRSSERGLQGATKN